MDGRAKAYILFVPFGIGALVLISVGLGGQGWFVLKEKNHIGLESRESVFITMGLWRLCFGDKCLNLMDGATGPYGETIRSGLIYLQVPMVVGEVCTTIGLCLIHLVMFMYARDSTYEGTNVIRRAGVFFLIGAVNVAFAVIRGGIANTELSRATFRTVVSMGTPWTLVVAGFGGALLFLLGICTIVFAYKLTRGLSSSAGDRVVLTERVV